MTSLKIGSLRQDVIAEKGGMHTFLNPHACAVVVFYAGAVRGVVQVARALSQPSESLTMLLLLFPPGLIGR
jgi:hypothetical protein